MLNSIANAEIKAQIDEMRPSAPIPAADQQPGIYKQYISVKLESDGGNIYTSTTKDYPSTKNAVYDQPIPMADGENTIYAVTIKDNLISQLAIYSYTISGVVEDVTIEDAAMDLAVREALGITADAPILTSDLWKITNFVVPTDAKNYDVFRYMTNMVSLTVESGVPQQLFQISSMKNLKELSITNTAVSAEVMETISTITTLEKLTLSGCGLTSIRALKTLTKLT